MSALLLEEGALIRAALPKMREYLRFMARGAHDPRPKTETVLSLAAARALVRFAKALAELTASAAAVRAALAAIREEPSEADGGA